MVVRRWVLCSVLPHSSRRPCESTSSTQANPSFSEDQRIPQTSWFRAHSPYCKLTTIASRRARSGSRPAARASICARIASTACGESAQAGTSGPWRRGPGS